MKKVLGLALGSGGAKGIVHIGALQALEEENIKFKVVTGSSIGSIIAGMYALGYSSREMIGLINEMGLNKLKFILGVKFKNQPLQDVLKNLLGEVTFNDLLVPYSAVATNLDTGKEEIINKGDLCLAMAASSAIPPAFNPVIIDGKRLVDGAFLNSIPADVCKNMGANYVLGIDLSADRPMNFSALKVLKGLKVNHSVKKCSRSYNGYKYADIIIAPDLTKFHLASVSKSDVLFDIGYTLVKNNISKIKEKLNV